MQLAEQHRIDRRDPRFAQIDAAAFASKNLYNSALYVMRQQFIRDHTIIAYNDLDKSPQPTEQYKTLPSKVSQWVLKQVTFAWKNYTAACIAWNADPSKFLGHPKLPQYLDKQGRNLLTYTEQAISKVKIRDGVVVCSGMTIQVKTRQALLQQVRIVPHTTHYTVEVIYPTQPKPCGIIVQVQVTMINFRVDNTTWHSARCVRGDRPACCAPCAKAKFIALR